MGCWKQGLVAQGLITLSAKIGNPDQFCKVTNFYMENNVNSLHLTDHTKIRKEMGQQIPRLM